MADARTDKVDLIKPEIGGSNSTWGNKLNEDMDKLETWLVDDRTALLSGLQRGNAPPGASLPALIEDDPAVILNDDSMRTAKLPLYYAQDVDLVGAPVTPGASGYKPGTLADIDFVYRMIDSLLPVGTIVAWYGTAAAIPDGWALCNGLLVGPPGAQVQTPDLRGRFIMAAYDPAATPDLGDPYYSGGVNDTPRHFNHSHKLTIGAHSLTRFEIPGHVHNLVFSSGFTPTQYRLGTTTQADGGYSVPTTPGNFRIGTQDDGNVGAGGIGGTAAGHSHENSSVGDSTTPGVPWIALCYIMKVKKFAG